MSKKKLRILWIEHRTFRLTGLKLTSV
ncbi:unnamed protein product [Debaryomyces tyrocola]|nr:unnamed protein product [Debaryomyces tyrocola]